MRKNHGRSAIRGKRSAPRKRLVLNPPAKRSALLAGTALATGVLAALAVTVAMPRPAMAEVLGVSCLDNPDNTYECFGPETTPLLIEPNATFSVNFGPDTDNPFEGDFNDASPGVTIDAGGFSTTGGGVHFNTNSYINNEGGDGLYIVDVGDVTVNIDGVGAGEGDVAASIVGYRGIVVDGQGFNEGGEGDDIFGDSITINNYGHVQGTNGSAIDVTNVSAVNINNYSYTSSVGSVNGDYIHDVDLVNVVNHGGLTAGLTNDGLNINMVSGFGGTEDGDVVAIDNTEGGVFAGYWDGIDIEFVGGNANEGDANDVFIQNQATFAGLSEGGDPMWTPGGLIAGKYDWGVYVYEAADNVTINNNLTRQGSIDLSLLDPDVYGSEGDPGLLYGALPNSDGFTTGIFGGEDGIGVYYIGGDLSVWNQNGQIVGANEDGINFAFITGSVVIDNGSLLVTDYGWVPGGTIWGAEDGIDGSSVLGEGESGLFGESVSVWNDFGSVFGGDRGVAMSSADKVGIYNPGGLTWGHYGNAIDVTSTEFLGVFNGGATTGDGDWWEGLIVGGDSAINFDGGAAFVFNGEAGSIVGDGDDGSVMHFMTDNGEGDESGGTFVFNGGLMTSDRNPNFSRGWSMPDVNELPVFSLDTDAIFEDAANIASYAKSGGVMGDIANLADYGPTASDFLLHAEGGSAFVLNAPVAGEMFGDGGGFREEAAMFGRIVADGETYGTIYDPEAEGGEGDYVPFLYGNVVMNFGRWFTTNEAEIQGDLGGNILTGEGDNAFVNLGFIQTAFGTEGGDYTSFVSDGFFNGGLPDETLGVDGYGLFLYEIFGEGDVSYPTDGWISMVDGSADDETYIYSNFYGATDPMMHSYLAVDTYFDIATGTPASDEFEVGLLSEGSGDTVFGTTGIVVNRISPDGNSGINTDGIKVVDAGTVDESVKCGDGAYCKEGDAFFISDMSPDFQNIDGYGTIRDGFFAWYLQERGDPEYYFVSEWGPEAQQQPQLTTAAQNVWYDTGGVVEDHVYGNVYPDGGGGGAGADLMLDTPYSPPPAAKAGHGSAIWGKMTGSWTNSDTEVSVDDGINVINYDTSLDQNTFSLLGGIEMRPGAGESGIRLGAFGGFLTSNASFDSYGASADYSGGTVGAYAALINGPFYVDAEVKGDFLNVSYSSPYVDLTTNANSIGVLANTGYRMENGNGFIEPIASFSYVNTTLGDTDGGGASVTYSNGQSVRAGAGARIGTSFASGNGGMTEVSLLGKIWNEFGDANTVTLDDGGGNVETFSDSITGVFGEVTGTATMYSADRMTSGFVSAGAKFGSDFTTINAKAGVRRGF